MERLLAVNKNITRDATRRLHFKNGKLATRNNVICMCCFQEIRRGIAGRRPH